MNIRRHIPSLALVSIFAAPSAALADEIVTDRPDVAESSRVVGAGRFQRAPATVQADGGLTFMVTDLVQLDAYARTSLIGATERLGLGCGASAKF